MAGNIQHLRKYYKDTRAKAYKNDVKKIKLEDVTKYKQEAIKELERMNTTGEYENLEEVDFYKDKFTDLETNMKFAAKNKLSSKKLTPKVQQILNEQGFAPKNLQIPHVQSHHINPAQQTGPMQQSRVLKTFFEQKKSKVAPELGYKIILENVPVSHKSFRTRFNVNNQEIQKLKQENYQLRKKIEARGGMKNSTSYDIQLYERTKVMLKSLQDENDRLLRVNTQLRSEKSGTIYSSGQYSYEQSLYSPYFIQYRDNDLQKINARCQSSMGYSNFNPEVFNDGIGDRNKGQDSFSDQGQRSNRERYSIFEMDRSYFSESHRDSITSGLGIESNRTATRNKAAFFKQGGMLIKSEDIDIAFKRTGLNQKNGLTKNRIIFYFNNKTGQNKKISIDYDYSVQHYQLEVKERVGELPSFKQGRQVVEIKLRQENDINAIIEAVFVVDDRRYKIWVPAMFIQLGEYSSHKGQQVSSISNKNHKSQTFNAHRLFSSPSEAKKLISKLEYEGDYATLWGQSSNRAGPIHLHWKGGNQLEVKAPQEWLTLVSFIMHEYN